MLLLPIASRREPDTGYPVKTQSQAASRCHPDVSYPAKNVLPIMSRQQPDADHTGNALLPISSRQAALTHTPDKKYSIGRQLGEGGHGTVHLSVEVATGDKVAIKIISVQNIKEAAVECTTMGIMSHPHIVPLQETIVDLDSQRIFLVMELCRGGDLFDLIAEVGKLDEPTARNYFGQMTSALVECHDNGVHHRDLKPENILLDESGNIKIADFGLAIMAGKDIRSLHKSQTLCGSMPYIAPEVLTFSDNIQYSAAKLDVWSLGIVLFIMLTGKQPFTLAVAEDCPSYASYLEHGLSFKDCAKGLSGEAAKLLQEMLNPNPMLRLTMSEALASPWLTGSKHSPEKIGKWCEMIGYDEKIKIDASKFGSQASTHCPSYSPSQSEGEEDILQSSDKFLRQETFTSTHCSSNSPSSCGEETDTPTKAQLKPTRSVGQRSSAMREGDTVNDMLVRTLGWVQMPAPKEKLIGQVTAVLDGLGVEYSIAQGEFSHVVKVQVPDSAGDDLAAASGSSSTCTSANDAASGLQTHMAGQLNVQLEIIASSPSKTDFHVKRQKGCVLRFHSFYHDLKNQLASSNGWNEKAGRYLRIAEAQ